MLPRITKCLVPWTVSLSYDVAGSGIIPYVTLSEQATVIAGQGAELTVSNVASGEAFDASELTEYGIKGELLEDDRLYFSLSRYEQERTDFSAQSIVTNRPFVLKVLSLNCAAKRRVVRRCNPHQRRSDQSEQCWDGNRFSFYGGDDLPLVPPHLVWWANGGPVNVAASGGRRAGMPENIFSAYGTYLFDNGYHQCQRHRCRVGASGFSKV